MMDKTELLFRMMEQPEKYDEGQWREILSDKQCRDLYSMMSATKSALDAERYDQQADDATLQQEWERLVLAHPQSASRHYTWRSCRLCHLLWHCGRSGSDPWLWIDTRRVGWHPRRVSSRRDRP